MSLLTQYFRRELGDKKYEEMKTGLFEAGFSSVVSGLPAESAGRPLASIEHKVALTSGQQMVGLAALFLTSYYLFYKI